MEEALGKGLGELAERDRETSQKVDIHKEDAIELTDAIEARCRRGVNVEKRDF